jgi:hypothetical protein
VKQNRKAINRKYYEKSRRTGIKEEEQESEDVKKWRCTLLSKNTGLAPRPTTMSVDTYLDVHEKAQFLVANMGYESEDKKTNAMKLIMNESIRAHIDELNQQRLANHPRPTATTARASAPRAAQSSSPIGRGATRSSPPDVWVPLVMALLSVLANGRTSESILNTLRTHLTTITSKIVTMRHNRAVHPDTIATRESPQ